MILAARVLPFVWVVLAAGCGSPSMTPKGNDPDGGGTGSPRIADAARDRGANRVVGPTEIDASPPDAALDAEPDGGPDALDAGGPDTRTSAHACSAGHTCTGTGQCERACFNQLVYRCSCVEGRYVCTGCMSVDGGAADVRGGPAPCASGVADGRSCATAGAVCQQRGDGSPGLCACGDLGGGSRAWICQ